MWLPASIYERVPQFWLLLGLLFFVFGLYLGFEFEMIFAYLALGVLCIAYSAWVFHVRRTHRLKDTQSKQEPKAAKSETAENQSPEQSEGAPSF